MSVRGHSPLIKMLNILILLLGTYIINYYNIYLLFTSVTSRTAIIVSVAYPQSSTQNVCNLNQILPKKK